MVSLGGGRAGRCLLGLTAWCSYAPIRSGMMSLGGWSCLPDKLVAFGNVVSIFLNCQLVVCFPPCFIIPVSQYVASIILVCLLCLPVFYVNKLRLRYEGSPKYLGESVTGMEIGLRKRWRGLDAIILIGVPAWMLEDVQMNGSISDAHAQWFSHWKIRADNCDIMKWCHKDLSCYWGRELQKESTTEPQGCHLGLLILSIQVYYQATDPLLWLSQCLSWSRA